LILKMVEGFKIKNDYKDRFLLMKIPFVLNENKIVKAIEFCPDKIKYIHHVNGQLLCYKDKEKKNVFEGKNIVDIDSFSTTLKAYEAMKLSNDNGSLPGTQKIVYPNGIGTFELYKKGAFFFKDIHYGPSNKTETDFSTLKIWFTKEPIKRPTLEMQLGTLGISKIEPFLAIPANEVKTFKTQITLLYDMSMLTINPHMHLLGKSFWAFAIKPNGDTIPLIKIRKWDFRWQYFYTFKKIQKIPKGSTIFVYGTFDNTVNNPLNPNHPPKMVSEKDGSMKTSDEMFQFIITFVPYQKGDEFISLEQD
jgi:hypothetical protein